MKPIIYHVADAVIATVIRHRLTLKVEAPIVGAFQPIEAVIHVVFEKCESDSRMGDRIVCLTLGDLEHPFGGIIEPPYDEDGHETLADVFADALSDYFESRAGGSQYVIDGDMGWDEYVAELIAVIEAKTGCPNAF